MRHFLVCLFGRGGEIPCPNLPRRAGCMGEVLFSFCITSLFFRSTSSECVANALPRSAAGAFDPDAHYQCIIFCRSARSSSGRCGGCDVYRTAIGRYPISSPPQGTSKSQAMACGYYRIYRCARDHSSWSGLMQGLALLPLLAALSHAFYTITTRKLHDRDPEMTTLFYTSVVGTVASTGYLPVTWQPPDALGWVLMASVGALGALGHLVFIRALTITPPATLVPFSYVVLVWSAGYGYFLFQDVPDEMTLIGALIVIASGLYAARNERKTTPNNGG